jgi:hypothetical protein
VATLTVTLTRGTQDQPIGFAVEHAAPLAADGASFSPTQSFAPDDTSELSLEVEAGGADGVYPLLISADDGSHTRYASAVLVIDTVGPTASIMKVRFDTRSAVGTDGKVKQLITWSATDTISGVAAAQLDESPDGVSSWNSLYGPATPVGQTEFMATAGSHHYRLSATDAAGNAADPAVLSTSLVAVQENQAIYTKTWTKFGTGTTWGTTRFTKRSGASATFTFTGTDVIWVAQKGSRRGKAYVYVDNKRSSVDLFASSLQERRVVFAAHNLGPGQHTIKIVCRATNNRPRVDFDGLYILTQ